MSTETLWIVIAVVVAVLLIAVVVGLVVARKRRISLRDDEELETGEKEPPKGGSYRAGGGFNFSAGTATAPEKPRGRETPPAPEGGGSGAGTAAVAGGAAAGAAGAAVAGAAAGRHTKDETAADDGSATDEPSTGDRTADAPADGPRPPAGPPDAPPPDAPRAPSTPGDAPGAPADDSATAYDVQTPPGGTPVAGGATEARTPPGGIHVIDAPTPPRGTPVVPPGQSRVIDTAEASKDPSTARLDTRDAGTAAADPPTVATPTTPTSPTARPDGPSAAPEAPASRPDGPAASTSAPEAPTTPTAAPGGVASTEAPTAAPEAPTTPTARPGTPGAPTSAADAPTAATPTPTPDAPTAATPTSAPPAPTTPTDRTAAPDRAAPSSGTGSAGTGSTGTGSTGTGSAGTGSAGTGSAGTVTAPVAPGAPTEEIEPAEGRLGKLRGRLSRSRSGLGQSLLGLLGAGQMDEESWEDVEATLLQADLGPEMTEEITARLREQLASRAVRTADQARSVLHDVLTEALDTGQDRSVRALPHDGRPAVLLVVGVNGTGKTTTTGKLARVLVASGHTVTLGAADTFRAAAAEQLVTWGERSGAGVVRGPEGSDPASVAFDAVKRGAEDGVDAVLLDTAGRLHTKTGLMDELGKVKRVVEKQARVDEVLLVLDATTGQNGLTQARVFGEVVDVTGIALTKLDGTAKGGIVFRVQRELGVPVKLVGLGEGADDLAPFEPSAFVDALLD